MDLNYRNMWPSKPRNKQQKCKILSYGSSEQVDKAIYERRADKDLQVFIKESFVTNITEMDAILGYEDFCKMLLCSHFSVCSL